MEWLKQFVDLFLHLFLPVVGTKMSAVALFPGATGFNQALHFDRGTSGVSSFEAKAIPGRCRSKGA